MTRIIAEGHRGYCARYPENTLISYRAAMQAGVDAFEFDVWLSADGVPVIDTVSEVPGLVLACGFTGHGFGIAPGVGTVVSQLVAGEEPVCDISGLKYDRFYAKDVAKK